MSDWDTDLCGLNKRPPLHTKDDLSFWDDEHISRRILELHLDPDTDAASRRPEEIDRSARWIATRLPAHARVLDVGCGPGLYAQRLASRGMSVVGLDLNRAALEHADKMARQHGLAIDYRRCDMREMEFEGEFDAVLLVYGILGSLNDRDRHDLLGRVHRALRPGGSLFVDVMTEDLMKALPFDRDWYYSPRGFWRPGPHFVMQRAFEYDGGVFLHRTVVVERDADVSVYDMWDHTYTVDSIRDLLKLHGFDHLEIYSDLCGEPYSPHTHWLGVLGRKRSDGLKR